MLMDVSVNRRVSREWGIDDFLGLVIKFPTKVRCFWVLQTPLTEENGSTYPMKGMRVGDANWLSEGIFTLLGN